jgi:hypothetical protein
MAIPEIEQAQIQEEENDCYHGFQIFLGKNVEPMETPMKWL